MNIINMMNDKNIKKPVVSIIISTYNRSQFLLYTLDSITKQSIGVDSMEVIVVDDGSSEDIYSVIEPYFEKLNLKYFYQKDKGYRVAAARNIGIRSSTAPICVFIDSSLILGKDAIKEHLRIHNEEKYPCAVVGYVFGFDDNNKYKDLLEKLIEPYEPEKSIQILKEHKIPDCREPLYKKHGDDFQKWPAPWVLFWTCNVSARRESIVKVGMFDESYTTWGGEDTDLALALEKMGTKFVFNRAIETIHYPHEKTYPWAVGNKDGYKDFKRKQLYMHRKYNTPATKLWLETDCMELNNELNDGLDQLNQNIMERICNG
jgi:glycosyltransferase involved in cell wall biosynthesis